MRAMGCLDAERAVETERQPRRVSKAAGSLATKPGDRAAWWPSTRDSRADTAGDAEIGSRSSTSTPSICMSRTTLEVGLSISSSSYSKMGPVTLPDEADQVQESTLLNTTFCPAAGVHLSLWWIQR